MVTICRLRLRKIFTILFFLFTSGLILSKVIRQDSSQNEVVQFPTSQDQLCWPSSTPLHLTCCTGELSGKHGGRFRQAKNLTIRTVFIVGRSQLPKIQQRVEREAQKNGDIVALEMVDSYNNLTLKHLAGMRWGLKNCPRVAYMMKADDDALIDVRRAVKLLQSVSFEKNIIACRVVPEGSNPRRSGKWMVTRQDYPHQGYPEYCSGLAYFGTVLALARIYEAAISDKIPYLWIDDVFVTGLAAQRANVKRLDMSVWFARTELDVIKWMREGDGRRYLPWIVAEMSPRHWPMDALSLWNRIKSTDNEVPIYSKNSSLEIN
ncbi:beta-1,3-galactosyltransferase 1 [Caerostris extrusa]|uniref:Hexosyltransferase n=2 Tax=Caerostris extrusa TaxID=172846 RepID=A0AAV4ST69_CAEEX|nr:beta-1,3-galactosyltransferase 1 [Caerostris extrusa]